MYSRQSSTAKCAGIKPVHLRFCKNREISFPALASEKNVVLTPKDDCVRLLLFEKRLPLGIKRNIGAVIVKEIQLDLACVGPLKSRKKV